ncbi:MAG: hypothetical protein ACR2QG_05600 [Gammaproteobacteria bacterium]
MKQQLADNLFIIHRHKDAEGQGMSEQSVTALSKGLLVDTCLRQLWINPAPKAELPKINDASYIHGSKAYGFLLQTICGLNSSVPGETNITGQFKCAWKRWRSNTANSEYIDALMNELLEDSKLIRLQHLNGTGGASYGSLVRKLIQPLDHSKLLFVGAGKFATSMMPFFSRQQVALWNHRLHPGLEAKQHKLNIFAPDEFKAAAEWAESLILTTPASQQTNERRWQILTTEYEIKNLVHLGLRRADPGSWEKVSGTTVFYLDDVFDLRSELADIRDAGISAAKRACLAIAYAGAELPDATKVPVLQGA